MKAFLLAAGKGTRLRPITDTTPKCLVPIQGRPLLGWWLELLRSHGVQQILINLHHLPEQVLRYVHTAGFDDLDVRFSDEPELLGSAGTLRANRHFVDPGEPFFVCYADTLTNADLGALLRSHLRAGLPATVAVFRTDKPEQCGIVEVSAEGVVVAFEEKPRKPRSNLANAGILVLEPAVLDLIPEKVPADISYDLLPRLIGKMSAFVIEDFLMDVGTPDNYEQAQRRWAELGVERAAAAGGVEVPGIGK